MALLRRSLILVHRYLGIPLSALFVLWFVTGIAMIYVGGMPALAPKERLAHLAPLDLARIAITPADAAARAAAGFGDAKLLTVLGRPAYRFTSRYGEATVFADDGTTLDEVDSTTARGVAAEFVGQPVDQLKLERLVEAPDQWTLTLSRSLPLYLFTADDGRGTEIYVSPSGADVRLVTTTKSRTLAWIATIPHWFYITPLRTHQPAWYWTVVVASGLGCVLAVLGLVLGVTQFKKSTPFSWSASVRYRGGLRWHYILGAFFGVFALTWVFSGLLSMEPFEWSNAEGVAIDNEAIAGGPVDLERFPPLDATRWQTGVGGAAPKEIELRRIEDRPYYLARYADAPEAAAPRERLHQPYLVGGRGEPEHVLVDAETLTPSTAPFSIESLLARIAAAAPDAPIAAHDLLADYDSYYYSRGRQAPLPVLRVKLADPLETWVYVDPALGEVLATVHRLQRLERWLYNGLHSLDFGFWYDRRPLWDIGMIALCLGALTTSVIGLWLGTRRLGRDVRRLTSPSKG